MTGLIRSARETGEDPVFTFGAEDLHTEDDSAAHRMMPSQRQQSQAADGLAAGGRTLSNMLAGAASVPSDNCGSRVGSKASPPSENQAPREGPTPLMRETPDAEPFPMEALGALRPAAEAAQRITQAPPALAACSALSVAALVTQGLFDVETLAGPKPLSAFVLSIAPSGERKSACDKLLMRPIEAHGRDLSREYAAEGERYTAASELWQARRKDILQNPHSEGAEADLEALGPEPEAPLLPLLTATDPTVEGITRWLGRARPALGIFSDEGGAFLGGHGMSRDNRLKTVATLSSFWDGAPVNRTRGGDGVITHYGKRLSMHLIVQPVAAETVLADDVANAQGFLARFLVTAPPSTAGTRFYREALPHDLATLDEWSEHVEVLFLEDLPLADGTRNELAPPVLPLHPDARSMLIRFHDEIERALSPDGPLDNCRAFASKTAEHAARIAGIMTAFNLEKAVSAETMTNAIKIAKYFLSEANRMLNAAAVSRETARLERLRTWLIEVWGKREEFISPTDAVQQGPVRETKPCKAMLTALAREGWLEKVPEGAHIRGKFRRTAYRIVRP